MRVALVVLALGACDPPPVSEPQTILDVDVVVEGGLFVYAREPARPCECTWEWPAPGECTPFDDTLDCGCNPEPGACLTSVRVEADGVTVAQNEREYPRGAFRFPVPGLYGEVPLELVLEGCGAAAPARLPLPMAAMPAPTVTSLTRTAEGIVADWSSPAPTTGAIVQLTRDLIGGTNCHGTAAGRTVGAPAPFQPGGPWQWLTLTSLDGGQEQAVSVGTARVWRGGSTTISDLFVPEPTAGGLWTLESVGPPAMLEVAIDGSLAVNDSWGIGGTFAALEGDPLVAFSSAGLGYRAGAVTDTVTWTAADGATYQGELPHVAPAPGVLFGDAETDIIDLTVGPVVLERTDAPGDPVELQFHLVWPVGVVVRPEP